MVTPYSYIFLNACVSLHRDYKIYVVVLPSNTEGSSRQVKSVDDIDIFDWSTVYEKVDQTSKPAAYIAFVFLSEEYNNYRTFTLGDEEKYPAKRIRRAKEEFRNGKLRSNREYVIFVRAYVSDVSLVLHTTSGDFRFHTTRDKLLCYFTQ